MQFHYTSVTAEEMKLCELIMRAGYETITGERPWMIGHVM